MRDLVLDEHALPLGAHDHAAARLVVDAVALHVWHRAFTQHDAVLVLVDLVVRDRALRLVARHVDGGGLPSIEAIALDHRHTVVTD